MNRAGRIIAVCGLSVALMMPPPIKRTSVSCSFGASAFAAIETAFSPTAREKSTAVIFFIIYALVE